MASRTALVYDDEMTSHQLLWNDPVCQIEVPERLFSCWERLQVYNLIERCTSVPVREGTEDEILLAHSSDYLGVVKNTEKMMEEDLQKTSAEYDAVYFHPTTYRCAKLAVGATLELVDAVMSGKTLNGMALVRPPGHHSQRSAANGFCIFNNVAIAAKYAQIKYGLQRILIVDWDVHHGQGTQYTFSEDPRRQFSTEHRDFPILHSVLTDTTPLQDLSTKLDQTGKAEFTPADAQSLAPEACETVNRDEIAKTDKFLERHMKEIVFPTPSVRTAVAVDESNTLLLPPSLQIEKAVDRKEFTRMISGFDAKLVEEEKVLTSLTNMMTVLDKIIRKEIINGLAVSCAASVSSAMAIKYCSNQNVQKVLCISVGDVDMEMDVDDGKVLLINVSAKPSEQSSTKYKIFLQWKEDTETTTFFSAVTGFILPVAYSFQPELIILVIGQNQSLGKNGISLLISFLQGLAHSQIFTLIQDTEVNLLKDVVKPLTGDFVPYFGTYAPALKENEQRIADLRQQLQQEWKMLQCSV